MMRVSKTLLNYAKDNATTTKNEPSDKEFTRSQIGGFNMTNDYQKKIEQLEKENERFDTTEAQREANKWRVKQLKHLIKPKPPVTNYMRLDPIRERLKDESFTVRPSHFLAD